MADTKISALPEASDLTGADLAGIQGGVNKKFPGSLFGGGSYLSATFEFDNDEILALPTVPIKILDAPGANKLINVINIVSYLDATGGVYGDVSNAEPSTYYDGTGGNITLGGDLEMEDTVKSFVLQPTDTALNVTADAINKGVMYYLENSAVNYTGGNAANTLKVTVYYVVVDL